MTNQSDEYGTERELIEKLLNQQAELIRLIVHRERATPSAGEPSRGIRRPARQTDEYSSKYADLVERYIADDGLRAGLKQAVTDIKAPFNGGVLDVTKLPALVRGAIQLRELLAGYSEDEDVLAVFFSKNWDRSDDKLKEEAEYRNRRNTNWFIRLPETQRAD